MTISTPKASPDYAIDSSTAVAPTCDSGEEYFEDTHNDIHHESSTAISNMINNVQPSQCASFENSDSMRTPPSTSNHTTKKARTDNGCENIETESAVAVSARAHSHTVTD